MSWYRQQRLMAVLLDVNRGPDDRSAAERRKDRVGEPERDRIGLIRMLVGITLGHRRLTRLQSRASAPVIVNARTLDQLLFRRLIRAYAGSAHQLTAPR